MKKLYSYIKDRGRNHKITIESILNPGLPKVSFSGFHEASAKEALVRVKSAIQNQDFEWSLDRHLVLSALGFEKLKSPFCDLSIAASILSETEQLEFKAELDVVFVGELGIDGSVGEFSLSENGFVPEEGELWIGNFLESTANTVNIKNLSDLGSLQIEADKNNEVSAAPSSFTNQVQMISPDWIELFELMVHGEHSLLFLTPQNPALIDFFKLVQKNLKRLSKEESKEVRLDSRGRRPFVVVNPSITKWQVLGMSSDEKKGLYYYGNGGVVCMDHFFTIQKGVREAVGSLIRGGSLDGEKTLKSLLFARSPLCPCGKAQVGVPRKCSFSLYKCRSMIEKISLDELSLFQVVLSGDGNWQELYPHPDVDLTVLNQRRDLACTVQTAREQTVPNSRLALHDLTQMMSADCKVTCSLPRIEGLERTRAILSVARTLADLEGAIEIEVDHVERAKAYVFRVPKEVVSSF